MKCRYNKPTTQQQKIIRQECVKEFDKLIDSYNIEVALQVLHILRFDFGFGQERLHRFLVKLKEMQDEQENRYELPPEETKWLCKKQLEDSGINVEELLKC